MSSPATPVAPPEPSPPEPAAAAPGRIDYLGEVRAMGKSWFGAWRLALSKRDIGTDMIAGLTLAAVALPLNLALAVASGLPPQAGLVAGAIGGALGALFGGSSLQVTGPAAALSTMVLSIVADFGVVGAAAAAFLVGGVQLVLGAGLAGRLVKFIPESVLVGFTTGVGLKLLDNQIPELLGFDYRVAELVQMIHRPEWLHEVSWLAVLSGLAVAFLVVSMRAYQRVPAALIGVVVVTALSSYLGWHLERVGMIPAELGTPALPLLTSDRWVALLWRALPLGVLASVESLLSARAVDRLSRATVPHSPNLELLGQGIANLGSGLMGAMPVSGVIVRSSVNVQSGGKTRRAALLHALALAVAVLYFSRPLAGIPLAALAGLLCVVGMRLIELPVLLRLWKEQKLGAIAFVLTAAGTVTGHLMLGLVAGLIVGGLGLWLAGRDEEAKRNLELRRQAGIRAVVKPVVGEHREPVNEIAPPMGRWLANIRAPGQWAPTAFVHPQASVVGRVLLGEHVHIAANTSVRADEGTPFFIGDGSNLQDGVVIHALKDGKIEVEGEEWAVYIGRNVSVAHQALIHGPCYVGDGSFVGFKAVVHDSVIGARCYVGFGAVVTGVDVPEGRFVPHGAVVDSAEKARALPEVTGSHVAMSEAVVSVNRALAKAYRHEKDGLKDEHD